MKGLAPRVILLAAIAALSGCGGFAPALIGEQRPEVRIFNAVDGKAIVVNYYDIYGDLLGTSPTVPYQSVSATNTIISNTQARPIILSNGAVVFKGVDSLYQINAHYTLYVGGVSGTYVEVPLNDSQGLGPTAGSAEIRAVHVGSNVAGVDVYVVPTGTGVAGVPVINSLTYSHVSAGGNTTGTIDGNGYVTTAITANASYDVILTNHNSTVPLSTTTVVLNTQNYYTAVVYDNGAVPGVQVLKD